ncbi:MAG TPA: hypothetical protein VFQ54_04310, partial [Thermomicrobiales bacterium]|nr:hypothetical protein [Thermomicrobiales bacterium]
MSSNTSPSPGSSDRRIGDRRMWRTGMVGGWRSWPIEVYFPIFLAALLCSAIAPLLHLFLNPHFGL